MKLSYAFLNFKLFSTKRIYDCLFKNLKLQNMIYTIFEKKNALGKNTMSYNRLNMSLVMTVIVLRARSYYSISQCRFDRKIIIRGYNTSSRSHTTRE